MRKLVGAVGIENNTGRNFKDLEEMLGNAKAFDLHPIFRAQAYMIFGLCLARSGRGRMVREEGA
jgi:hypothetical protein